MFSTGAGRDHYYGFTVLQVTNGGRRLSLKYDKPPDAKKDWTLVEWRRPGHWIPMGVTQQKFRYKSFQFGEKRTGVEAGIF